MDNDFSLSKGMFSGDGLDDELDIIMAIHGSEEDDDFKFENNPTLKNLERQLSGNTDAKSIDTTVKESGLNPDFSTDDDCDLSMDVDIDTVVDLDTDFSDAPVSADILDQDADDLISDERDMIYDSFSEDEMIESVMASSKSDDEASEN